MTDFGIGNSAMHQTISGDELGILARFVASQAVRTLGHKDCIQEQARAPVDTETFVRVMGRKTIMLLNNWISNPRRFGSTAEDRLQGLGAKAEGQWREQRAP